MIEDLRAENRRLRDGMRYSDKLRLGLAEQSTACARCGALFEPTAERKMLCNSCYRGGE